MATTTAAAASAHILYERPDIQKSCKSLESLMSVLNDYCEAAGAVVSLQRKLAKALRDNASSKATNDVAANALNASATIFEALSDIESNFSKIADKECDGINDEVQKWFKKLAKEEKTHDEKIANANGKIKQAGQLVSQRHTSTTISVAACVSRIADGEWTRSCEGVRRIAPTIGLLGQYRGLCEGGWSGPMHADLPDIDDEQEYQQAQAETQPMTVNTNANAPSEDERLPPPTYRNQESPRASQPSEPSHAVHYAHPSTQQEAEKEVHSPQSSPSGPRRHTPSQAPNTKLIPPSSFESLRPPADPNTGSVRALSAYLAHPTHSPPPLSPDLRHQQLSFGQSSQSSSNIHASQSMHSRPSDVHIPTVVGNSSGDSLAQSPVTNFNSSSPHQRPHEGTVFTKSVPATDITDSAVDAGRPFPARFATLPPAMETSRPESYLPKVDYPEDAALAKKRSEAEAAKAEREREGKRRAEEIMMKKAAGQWSDSGSTWNPPSSSGSSRPRIRRRN